jgi:hypothetical protein
MVINYTRATLAAAVACGSLLAASCGSSSHNSKASVDSPSAGSAAAVYKYAACMRSHGVPNFPDPQVSSSRGSTSVKMVVGPSVGIDPHAPAFRAADQQCQGILPVPTGSSQGAAQQHLREVDLVSFAQCLRAHGLPDFPDPTAQGQLNVQMITKAGVDLHAPQTLTAAKECIGASHGAITPADVEQAVNGPQ